jgi:hypothetical protein
MKSKLDFTGGTNSWFDFWHTHIDWNGEGNKSFEIRHKYLLELLSEFEKIKSELKKYPNDFQTWIVIDETDSSEDAIYIHTKNPNEENFPLKMENKKWECENKNLSKFMIKTGLKIVEVKYFDGKGFYLFDEKFGESIIK